MKLPLNVTVDESSLISAQTGIDAARKFDKESPNTPSLACINPSCDSSSFTRVAGMLEVYYDEGGIPRERHGGGRYSCQRCGAEMCLDRSGAYRPHRAALPVTLRLPNAPQQGKQAPNPNGDYPDRRPPIARQRPVV